MILKALDALPDVERLPVRNFGEKPIRAVHDTDFVNYLRNFCQDLPKGEMVYPYVFPIRRTDRPPHDRSRRAGYYCIDTFTPLSHDAYKAARAAVNVALSGAEAIRRGAPAGLQPLPAPGPPRRARHLRRLLLLLQRRDRRAVPRRPSVGRVAILDIDYHHGNGAQDIFYNRSDVLTISIHGHPNFAYPYFSGFADEIGEGRGQGIQPQPPARRGRRTTAAISRRSTRRWRSSASSSPRSSSSRSASTSPRPTRPAPGASRPTASSRSAAGSGA